ncbi:hypothetical protein LCGC14_0532240 [marine sediment metagenome]|uniref:Uncharacterized protein n=1 Tax=marine sediment metagenome TaxID=412755 RepID=A0A0F9RVB4_9ZZZZ
MVTPIKEMRPKHLLCRIVSIRRTTDNRPEPQEPTPQTWEVRAVTEGGVGDGPTSIFYTESDPRNLPPLESLIHITIDNKLTCDTLSDTVPEVTDSKRIPLPDTISYRFREQADADFGAGTVKSQEEYQRFDAKWQEEHQE